MQKNKREKIVPKLGEECFEKDMHFFSLNKCSENVARLRNDLSSTAKRVNKATKSKHLSLQIQ